MRFVEFVCNAEDEEEYRRAVEQHKRDKMVRSAEWDACVADNVLDMVDEQLDEFGLEVVQYETGVDYYEWHIERRLPRTAAEAVQFVSDELDQMPQRPIVTNQENE